jgi:multidrug resistance efflux pump
VPVQPNRLVKKGELPFRIDPTPFVNEAAALKAQLAQARFKLNEATAKLSETSAGVRELRESLKAAGGWGRRDRRQGRACAQAGRSES